MRGRRPGGARSPPVAFRTPKARCQLAVARDGGLGWLGDTISDGPARPSSRGPPEPEPPTGNSLPGGRSSRRPGAGCILDRRMLCTGEVADVAVAERACQLAARDGRARAAAHTWCEASPPGDHFRTRERLRAGWETNEGRRVYVGGDGPAGVCRCVGQTHSFRRDAGRDRPRGGHSIRGELGPEPLTRRSPRRGMSRGYPWAGRHPSWAA